MATPYPEALLKSRLRPLAACLTACLTTTAIAASSPVAQLSDLLAMTTSKARAVGEPARASAVQTVSNCNDSGAGSLRDALTAAADGETVDLTQLGCSRITLSTGAIVFGAASVAVHGPGENALVLDGDLDGGVLYHLGAGTLIVNNLSIANGHKYRSDNDVRGGCVHTEGNVLLTNVAIDNCMAVSASNKAALGGAVWSAGVTQLDHSRITGSEAHATGNGYASGGGVYALGGFVSLYSTIDRNVVLSEAASTPTFGGGAFARGPVLIIGTTVSNNQAARMGGLALADNNSQGATLINTTVSGNRANRMGGIFARPALNLYNTTIAFNTSHEWSDGAGHFFGAGLYTTKPGQMNSTIIANNVNTDPAAPTPTADFTHGAGAGFNGANNNVMFCSSACPNDTTHEDPGLHPLRDNGGPTLTHVPTPGQWDTFGGTNLLNSTWDQRGPGFPRNPPGISMEIGAFQPNPDLIFANGFN
ncbi:MAG: choice-of-anchor Q domain-containing protein [Dokdonella sp.]|uniref:choice-of-anchor Q domain-containing protein n=1 Tax=Dokdonella sp. TaxID=2291710 RepID=UPI0032635056